MKEVKKKSELIIVNWLEYLEEAGMPISNYVEDLKEVEHDE